jgi:hypothetical protein
LKEIFMQEIEYGAWIAHPGTVAALRVSRAADAIWKKMATECEGDGLYRLLWNF